MLRLPLRSTRRLVPCSLLTLALVALWLWGCERKALPSDGSGVTSSEAAGLSEKPAAVAPVVDERNLLDEIALCDVRHRGLAIDVGSVWGNTHRGFVVGPFDDVDHVSRAAVSTGAVKTKKLVYDFWLDRPAKNVHIDLRAQGVAARSVIIDVDDLRLGHQTMESEQPKVHRFGPVAKELQAGRHRLTVRFRGRRRSADLTKAFVDWLRVYIPDGIDDAYIAPTKHNLLQDVALNDVPRHSIALRAPGSVRCPTFPSKGTRLVVDLGYWGSGEGVAQVRVRTHDGRDVVLAEHKVEGEDSGGSWIPLELSLDAFSERLAAIEFVALEGRAGGRVVFGEPKLKLRRTRVETPKPKNVILVVAGGLDRRLVPPWVEREKMPELWHMVDQSVVFDGYRSSATVVSGVMASLLTGARPHEHQMLDSAARVPDAIPLISEGMRRTSGSSAFFTNVPYTFGSFGFERGWNEFAQFSPVKDLPATEPLRVGRKWLEDTIERGEEGQRLLVIHASGAHPPWDVTQSEAKVLPPKDYSGSIDARRAAIYLRNMRNRTRGVRRLGSSDWLRLTALQEVALRKFDTSFGLLRRSLQESGEWDDSLVVFMGDVGMGAAPTLPFAPFGRLDEGRLAAPLYVKFPAETVPGRTQFRFGPEVVARTLHESVGVSWPGSESTPTLGGVAKGSVGLLTSGFLAMQGHSYAYYLGPWRLQGVFSEAPTLCDLEVDPSCGTDLLDAEPFVAQWMWRALLRTLADQRDDAPRRQSATIDDRTRAALQVYGL